MQWLQSFSGTRGTTIITRIQAKKVIFIFTIWNKQKPQSAYAGLLKMLIATIMILKSLNFVWN